MDEARNDSQRGRSTPAATAAVADAPAPQSGAVQGGAAPAPSPFTPPSISLPKGGGAIRGIGEKFAANPVTGTGSMSVPVITSPGRSGFGPQLSLSYDSGAGNGAFGFGWSLSLPQITRKTDKGLPLYDDVVDSDVFLLAGSEDLVPADAPDDTASAPGFSIRRYRPRIEGLFARIERWTRDDGDVHWRSISKDNVLTVYGKDANSRIFDPDPTLSNHIFAWLICETRDDRGNGMLYVYQAEDGEDLDLTQAHEANRGTALDPRRKVNRYIKRIFYGNRTPLLSGGVRPAFLTPQQVANAAWMFEVVFDYDEGHLFDETTDGAQNVTVQASTAPAHDWTRRNDPFSSYRAGFEVRTYRLCQRVLMFHHIPDISAEERGYDGLVRSTDFTYTYEGPQDPDEAAANPVYSFLASVTQSGYVKQGARYLKRSLPPVELDYTRPVVQSVVEEVGAESLENLPGGLGSGYRWIDLHGEGIPGVLTEQAGEWFYKRNSSPINTRRQGAGAGSDHVEAKFDPLEVVSLRPNASLGSGAQFMDLAGDGQPDLVVLDGPLPGLFEHDGDTGWLPFRPFIAHLNRAFGDPNLKLVDLSGDGRADILITEDDALVWHPSLGEDGFGPAQRVARALDEEKGPRLVFADGEQAIYLADMSGDGLADLARIRNGEVCYWPNLGYGRFGAKVTMDHGPVFDSPEQFDQARIRMADIDGSGTTDIIYLHRDGVRLYFNQSGNGWGGTHELPVFPAVDSLVDIQAADLLGNGTTCLVWSSPLPGDARRQMRYVNLMGDQKPHLLVGSANNLGAETRVRYASSTKFYLQDRKAGRPWVTRLPFPVHVVERLDTYDHVSRSRFVTSYRYHHGYFDGDEREFRGFGMVEQTDTEQFAALTATGAPLASNEDAASHVPPVLTRTWYHTGVYLNREHISQYFAGLEDGRDRGEYYREPAWLDDDDEAKKRLLPDTVLPPGLTLEEEREACRSLKGMMLRQEIYGLDGIGVSQDYPAGHPYTVAEQNFSVRMLQARGLRRHAVFFTHPHEAVTYHYERESEEPRVRHVLTLEVDKYGNVLKEAAAGYRRAASTLVEQWDKDRQEKSLVTYTENDVTAALGTIAAYRTPLPAESRTFELTGYTPTGDAGRFMDADFVEPDPAASGRLRLMRDGDTDYEAVPLPGKRRRLIERIRTVYRRDDLTGLLAQGSLDPLALPGETYKLALTPGLLGKVFRSSGASLLPADPGTILESQAADGGGYVQMEGGWWLPSGRVFFSEDPNDTPAQELAEAQAHFYMPRRFRDPFGQVTHVRYDGPGGGQPAFDLLVTRTQDALGNVATAGNDYRVLGPRVMADANRNRTEVAFDALAMVVGTAVMGKPPPATAEGDSLTGFVPDLDRAGVDAFFGAADPHTAAAALLGDATTRVVYDLGRFHRSRQAHPDEPEQWLPAYSATLSREIHASDPGGPATRIRISFSYSDGFGREVQKKIQAEPGPTPQRDGSGQIVLGANGQPVMTPADTAPRWVGNGWTVVNNKGKPVRQYEPFFTDRHEFEFGVRVGVSPVLFYDPAERVVARLHPNHTWEKVVFDPWQQATYDVNDTVTLDPAADPDVRGFFVNPDGSPRIPAAAYIPTWHALRTQAAYAADFAARYPLASVRANETAAATKAAAHAGTPTIAHFDVLGRPFLTLADNGPDPAQPGQHLLFATRVEHDIEGNQRSVRDAVQQNGDRLGRVVMRYDYDILGNRIHQASMEAGERWTVSDAPGKPIRQWDSGDAAIVARRMTYDALRRPLGLFVAEGAPGAGVPERLARQTVYGEGQGDADNHLTRVFQVFDGAGIVTNVAYDFKGNVRSTRRDLLPDYKGEVDWNTNPVANAGAFATTTRYDALDRPVEVTTPDNSIVRPTYNEANQLNRVDIALQGGASTNFVSNIDYDAKNQRQLIEYGNGVRTTYEYDPLTFRLSLLRTSRPGGANGLAALFASPTGVQELRYTYDPSGNITRVEDAALKTVVHGGQAVAPACSYTYDALYRLVQAQGREHIGQTAFDFNPPGGLYRDYPFLGLHASPNDPEALRNYTEDYAYDEAGNFKTLGHTAAGGSWTRSYVYQEVSPLEPAKQSNRLTRTVVGNGVNQTETHGYDARGNMTALAGLALTWDFENHLREVDLGGGGTAYYIYDMDGRRVRKVVENQNGAAQEERIYLRGFEIYRKLGGNHAGLERQTLHVMDDRQRIALVETRNGVDDGTPQQVIRYQLGNHLGSAAIELTDDSALISYEEYHAYGTSAFQAVRTSIEVAPKRYRHTGKERDEETGLYYQEARYYAPWFARWTAADPAGLAAGSNLYLYCRNSPIKLSDPNGMDPPGAQPPVRVTPLLTDWSLTGATGNLQFHDILSSDRSVSGQGALGATGRASFLLDVPRLHLSTTGFADVSGLAAVDTELGRAGLGLRGGVVLGDPGGLNFVATGTGTFRIPVPGRIGIGGLPGSLLQAIPQGEGDARLSGSLSYGTFGLANFRARASLAAGRFEGRLDATTIGDIGRLRLDASGSVSPEGDVTLESARLRANVDVPGLNVEVRGTGTGAPGGSLLLNATGNVRLLGLPSLQFQGSGTASTSGVDFSGRFSGAGPLFTSYVFGGRFDLSTSRGISVSGGIVGLTYTPGVSITDPAPAPPGLAAVAGSPASPWTPSGLTLGASYFRYSQGGLSWISGGFIPDLSSQLLTNPRVGVTAGVSF